MRGPGNAARAAHDHSPEAVWAVLAPLMAARRRVRISRDGGRSYRRIGERPVTDVLPNQPAALLVYDRGGCAPVICLDLDASRGGPDAVTRDHAAITRLLDRFAARWFSDVSPNGGRHVYVPLAEPAPFHDARAFTLALAARTPTLDPLPMLNIDAGCIRPPGSRHRTGGHQRLDQSVSAAADALTRPTSPQVWDRLMAEVGAHATKPSAGTSDTSDDDGPAATLEPLHGVTGPDVEFTRIARTGEWPAEKYRTASEARQGVIWAAVASGWALVDVARRLSDGTWPGLAALYARYSPRHRHAALVRDWRSAVSFEQQRRRRRTEKGHRPSVRARTTSPHQTHARGPEEVPGSGSRRAGTVSGREVNREVRVWLVAVDLLTKGGDPAERAVLYALAEAAALTGDLVVEHGNRSLSIATGLDQSTVGRILARLREAPSDRLLVDLVRPAEGVRAHSYALVIPPLLRPACEKKPWRRGRIHAVRPAFRDLGLVAAFVYAALEQADEPRSGRDLAAAAGVGHTAAYDALAVLAAWGLADKAPTGGWILGSASLPRLAEQFGVDEQVAAQITRYRVERLAWWRYLGLVDAAPPTPEGQVVTALDDWRRAPPDAGAPPGLPERPLLRRGDDDVAELVALLGRVLGATVVERRRA